MTAESKVLKDLKKALKTVKKQLKSEKDKPKRKRLSASILFNYEEVSRMAKPLRREILRNGRVAHIIKWEDGSYEIRYFRNGYNISVTNTDLRTAKELFIKAI